MITKQLSTLPPIPDAHRTLQVDMPAMNAVQIGGTASHLVLPKMFKVAA